MTRISLKFHFLRIIHFYPPTSHAELRDFKLQYRCIPHQDLIRKELIIAHIGEKRPTNPWAQLPEGMDYFGNIYRSRGILKTNFNLVGFADFLSGRCRFFVHVSCFVLNLKFHTNSETQIIKLLHFIPIVISVAFKISVSWFSHLSRYKGYGD